MSLPTGKFAIVTGVSKGIGASIAERLVAERTFAVVNYVSSKSGVNDWVRRTTAKGGRAIATQADVYRPGTSQSSSQKAGPPLAGWTLW